jgi:hypothetical protein
MDKKKAVKNMWVALYIMWGILIVLWVFIIVEQYQTLAILKSIGH